MTRETTVELMDKLLQASHDYETHGNDRSLRDEYQKIYHVVIDTIERLKLENWQLKGALGYPVPGDIPEGDFKCGLCDARRKEMARQVFPDDEDLRQRYEKTLRHRGM